MKIGIDFDNTIVNTKQVSKLFLDKFMPDNNLKSYHELNNNEQLKFFAKFYKLITKNLTIFDGVYNFFEECKNKEIKLYLITARGEGYDGIIDLTIQFCKQNGLDFDGYIFKAYPKGKQAQDYELDLVIDDTYEVILDVRNHGINALQYGVDVKSWDEVITYVRKEYYGKNSRCK